MDGLTALKVRTLAVVASAAVLLFTLQCGTDQGPGGEIVISPGDVMLEVSGNEQFTASRDDQSASVAWYVDGVWGGTPETGTITTDGFFIAPSAIPAGGSVELSARAVADPAVRGAVTVEIVKPAGTAYVTVSPDTVSLLAAGTVDFASEVFDCASQNVVWSIERLWGEPASPGVITSVGQYAAPLSINRNFAVVVKALSLGCPTKTGIARVVVYAQPRSFDVELEQFSSSFNQPGSNVIKPVGCSNASGGLAVSGLDNPGEWIKVVFTIPVSGTYEARVRYQGPDGFMTGVEIKIEDCTTPVPQAEFTLDEGVGVG
jgi:hypothetical protein